MKKIEWTGIIELESPSGIRVDRYLSEEVKLCSRSQLKQLEPHYFIDGKLVKPSAKVKVGDTLTVIYDQQVEPSFSAEEIPLDIIYEDSRVIVINKPHGMVVHPGAGNWEGTLVQGLLHHCKELSQNFLTEQVRPGIVHRLDKDTSGVIIAAKDPESLNFLAKQFKKRRVQKEYLALVKGTVIESEGLIETKILRDPRNRKKFTWSQTEGKDAITSYKRLKMGKKISLVRFSLHTGRTHQIRVHASMLGHPILGDPLYGRPRVEEKTLPLMLHAYTLTLQLPDQSEGVTFKAPLPAHFAQAMAEYLEIDPNLAALD